MWVCVRGETDLHFYHHLCLRACAELLYQFSSSLVVVIYRVMKWKHPADREQGLSAFICDNRCTCPCLPCWNNINIFSRNSGNIFVSESQGKMCRNRIKELKELQLKPKSSETHQLSFSVGTFSNTDQVIFERKRQTMSSIRHDRIGRCFIVLSWKAESYMKDWCLIYCFLYDNNESVPKTTLHLIWKILLDSLCAAAASWLKEKVNLGCTEIYSSQGAYFVRESLDKELIGFLII